MVVTKNIYETIDNIESEQVDGHHFTHYDISVSPNDFNISTLFDFIQKDILNIPGFQRNYVWDIKRASRLIESIIMGLPIPQVFLFEEKRNRFLVIDGQQRFMTIFYFMKMRFPRKEKRTELRNIYDENNGSIPERYLADDTYFTDFKLQLPVDEQGNKNPFSGKKYETLDTDDKISFELRTIRNIVIKQNSPDDDNSAVFEIFNRLNSGGVNLRTQEIRTSLYHSEFYDMLYKLNLNTIWRDLQGGVADLHMRDVEIMLRTFAMLLEGDDYKASVRKFLNLFSAKAKKFTSEYISFLQNIFQVFLTKLPQNANELFSNNRNAFDVFTFEATFVVYCELALKKHDEGLIKEISADFISQLKADSRFKEATLSNTASTKNTLYRLEIARELFNA